MLNENDKKGISKIFGLTLLFVGGYILFRLILIKETPCTFEISIANLSALINIAAGLYLLLKK